MTQNPTSPEPEKPVETVPSETPDSSETATDPNESATPPAEESTIGTGTSMALGCIAGTVLLIIFGLIFLAVSRFV